MTKWMMAPLFAAGTLWMGVAQAACPSGTLDRGMHNGQQRCALANKYLSTDLTLTAENEYLIEGPVFFGADNKDNSTLRIEAGTVLRGAPGAFISIMRGSQIFAEGTATRPVVFTSIKDNNRKRGEWGGLVLNGNAPINACKTAAPVCEAVSEGIKVEQVKFGGNQPEDNSGILRYVRVEFAGYPISQDNELNGITFNGVGRGTTIEYIQVHMNADDGIEFFGGTANVKYAVLTGNDDDSLDWDMGWTGMGQFIVVEKAGDTGDNGVEADNLSSPMDASPRSNPILSNLTFLGTAKNSYGFLLRRGTGAHIMNSVVTGFGKACLNIDDNETFRNGAFEQNGVLQAAGLRLTNSVFNCGQNFRVEATDPWSSEAWFLAQEGNRLMDPQLSGWMPQPGSPLLGAGVTPEDLFFDPVDYIGAFGADEDWSQGWTTRAAN